MDEGPRPLSGSAQQREHRLKEIRGGSGMTLAVCSFVIASYAEDGWPAVWLGLAIFLFACAVAFMASADVVITLEEPDGDE